MRYSMMFVPKILVAAMAMALTVGCDMDGGDSDTESSDSLEVGSETEGDDSGVELVVNDIETVEADFVPTALEVDDSSNLLNPCAGLDGPIACTPNLVKLYLNISKMMVGIMREVINDTSGIINNLDQAEGEEQVDDGDIETIKYKVSSSKVYSVLLTSTLGPFLHVAVNRSDAASRRYAVKFQSQNMVEDESSDEDDGGPSDVDMSLTVTEDGFTATIRMGGSECENDDVRAPESFGIVINKTATTHSGQVLTYSPLWRVGDGTTCSDTADASTEMAMMTEFTGDDNGVTTNVYYADRNLTDIVSASDYSLPNLCNNYSGICNGQKAFGGNDPVSTYANPACVRDSTTEWGGECDGYAESGLMDKSTFPLPADYIDFDIGFPSDATILE